MPWLSGLLLELVRGAGGNVREVVLDADARGLRALVSITRGDDTDVFACTPQEGVGVAARGRLAPGLARTASRPAVRSGSWSWSATG